MTPEWGLMCATRRTQPSPPAASCKIPGFHAPKFARSDDAGATASRRGETLEVSLLLESWAQLGRLGGDPSDTNQNVQHIPNLMGALDGLRAALVSVNVSELM